MKYSDKAIWMVAGLVILFSVIWHITYNNRQHKVDLGKCRFVVEIAKTNKKRELGLVERDALCQRCGMLFEFSKKARYKFFMKGMRFPIDIVWIADDNIVGIERNISEKSIKTFQPITPVDRVLEINSNETAKCEIEIGEKMIIYK